MLLQIVYKSKSFASPLVLTFLCSNYRAQTIVPTLSQVSKVVKVTYRSMQVLREAPNKSQVEMEKHLFKHANKKGTGCKGRYELLLTAISTFTNRAFEIFSQHVAESENHHVVFDRNVVWLNYEQVCLLPS